MFKLKTVGTSLTLMLAALSSPVHAQATAYPNKIIRVVLPFAAGGPTDVIGRVIAHEMSNILGHNLVIETRPGASGTVGAAMVARAAPDGYTLLMNASSQVIYPAQFKSLSFDPIKDFTEVGVLGMVPMVAIVPPNSPHQDFKSLLNYAEKNPGKLSFASPGIATLPHLVGELVKLSSKTDIVHIGYKGSNPALTDVAGGHVDLMYAPLAPAVPLIQSGKVRPLAVTTKQRLKELPNVPTIAETAIPDFDIVTWYGLWAPKGTPADIVKKLNDAMLQASKSQKVLDVLNAQGTIPSVMNVEQMQTFAKQEHERWVQVMKDANIQPE